MRAILLVPFLCLATALAVAQSTSPLPAFDELSEDWHTLKPGGETLCAHGTEFEFYVRPADPERLLVYLYGGGGCWDAEECQVGSREYVAEIQPGSHPSRLDGILDVRNPENPFAGYSIIAVPVCTGDAHIGANDVVYTLEEGGTARRFTIHHRGKTNTLTAVEWAMQNFTGPREVFVGGSSAGSLGVPFHASLLARHYPDIPVTGLGDGAGSYGSGPTAGMDAASWGIPAVLREHPGWEAYDERAGIEALYVTAGRQYPNLRLYQVDYAHDRVQAHHIRRTGMASPNVHELLIENREAIRGELSGFRGYTIGGEAHVVLTLPLFYRHAEAGYPLRDWVAAIASGEDAPDVSCDHCHRAELIFHKSDLTLLAGAIAVLREPDAWDPVDQGGGCPVAADRFSLRCAFVEAGRRSGVPVANSAVAWEVTAAAAEDEPAWRGPNSVIHFNNNAGTTVETVIELLERVETSIQASMQDL